MKLIKGDEVKVIRGREKGKTGKIDKVLTKTRKVFVTELNNYKKHFKSRLQNKPSEIINIRKPLPLGNLVLICPNCHKETRVGYKIDNKEKIRYCKKCSKKI